jgi:hypothetical protein
MKFLSKSWLKFAPTLLLISTNIVGISRDQPLQAQGLLDSSVCDLPALSLPLTSSEKNLTAKPKPSQIASDQAVNYQLWWLKDQLEQLEKGLLVSWLVDAPSQRLDIIVDRQLWSQLNYLQRYRFVYHLGNVAREKHYNLRIFNQQNKCLVTYHCHFEQAPATCTMTFESPVESRFQIYTPAPGAFNFEPTP